MTNWATHETKMTEALQQDQDRVAKLNARFKKVSETRRSCFYVETV
jgi:hypothetical protein